MTSRRSVDLPLTEGEFETMRRCRPQLLAKLDLNGLEMLASDNGITWEQRQHIQTVPVSERDKTGILLDVMMRRNRHSYQQFLHWLRVSGQAHLQALLVKGGRKM